jgi:hypothetical protein
MSRQTRRPSQCGQEATWLKVWKFYGIPPQQVREFFAGPSNLNPAILLAGFEDPQLHQVNGGVGAVL